MVVLASVFYGFPPNFNAPYVPSNYSLFSAVGLIVFMGLIYFLVFADAKSKILPLTKWGITFVVSTIIAFVSFSVFYFSEFVTKQFEISSYFLLLLIVGSLISFISGRQINGKSQKPSAPFDKK